MSAPSGKTKKFNAPGFRGEYATGSEQETFLLAKKIGGELQGNEIVFLVGELGAGKTVFAKGIAAGLGLEDVHQVCSPTYTLMNVYLARVPIFHFDLYRLDRNEDILDLDWEDYIGRGIVIVEWAEKLKLGVSGVRVAIKIIRADERLITIEA